MSLESRKERGDLLRPRLLLGLLVLVLLAERLAEAADGLAERLAQLRELAAAEEKHDGDQDEDELREAEAEHGCTYSAIRRSRLPSRWTRGGGHPGHGLRAKRRAPRRARAS